MKNTKEIIIMDCVNEGFYDTFNEKLIKYFPIKTFLLFLEE